MSFIPSWNHDIHPRKCAGCGKSCRESKDWSRYYREICWGCLELFCKECAAEHEAFGSAHEKAKCGRRAGDWPDIPRPGGEDFGIPGWKAALIQKIVPKAIVTNYCSHTAGWHMQFFLNTKDPDAATLDRQALEEICEALHCAWTLWPEKAIRETYKDAEIPEEARDGVMVTLEYVT